MLDRLENAVFKNVGKTLCKIGTILFWLSILVGVIFIILWFVDCISWGGLMYGNHILLLLALVELISGFIFSPPIYGFGKLIQDVQAIREATKRE